MYKSVDGRKGLKFSLIFLKKFPFKKKNQIWRRDPARGEIGQDSHPHARFCEGTRRYESQGWDAGMYICI